MGYPLLLPACQLSKHICAFSHPAFQNWESTINTGCKGNTGVCQTPNPYPELSTAAGTRALQFSSMHNPARAQVEDVELPAVQKQTIKLTLKSQVIFV